MSSTATVADLNTQDSFRMFIGTTANKAHFDEYGREANLAIRETIFVQGASYIRYRISSLLFSSFALSVGFIDTILFFSKGTYFLHPSFDLLLLVGGFFLLLTTLLAIKGK